MVSAICVTDCSQHFVFTWTKFLNSKNALVYKFGSEKTSGEVSATPCFKKLSGALLSFFEILRVQELRSINKSICHRLLKNPMAWPRIEPGTLRSTV